MGNGSSGTPSCGLATRGPARWPRSTGNSPITHGCPPGSTHLLRPRRSPNSPTPGNLGASRTWRSGRSATPTLHPGHSSGPGIAESRSSPVTEPDYGPCPPAPSHRPHRVSVSTRALKVAEQVADLRLGELVEQPLGHERDLGRPGLLDRIAGDDRLLPVGVDERQGPVV